MTLLFRKAHWIVEVAQAPAPIMPVAVAMFRLHPFVAVGDIPTAVWPYEWAGWTPVRANLLALWLSVARVAVLRALLRACLMRAACFWVARLADELVSTPMSTPAALADIGMPIALALSANCLVCSELGTTVVLSEMSSSSSLEASFQLGGELGSLTNHLVFVTCFG